MFYGDPPAVVAGFFYRDPNGPIQGVRHVFAPLHGAHAAPLQIVLPADVKEVLGGSEPVHIEMEQGQLRP